MKSSNVTQVSAPPFVEIPQQSLLTSDRVHTVAPTRILKLKKKKKKKLTKKQLQYSPSGASVHPRTSRRLRSSKAAPRPRHVGAQEKKWLGPLVAPPLGHFKEMKELNKYLFSDTTGKKKLAMRLWNSTIRLLKKHGQSVEPTNVVTAILQGELLPNSKRQYLSAIAEQLPQGEFITKPEWKRVQRMLAEQDKLRKVHDPFIGKADRITPQIMLQDVLRCRRPSSLTYSSHHDPNFHKIVAFRCYVTAHRWGDVHGQFYKFHSDYQVVEVLQVMEKVANKESWSIFVPCTREQFDRVWQREDIPRTKVKQERSRALQFLKKQTASMSLHSFRNGAIYMMHRQLGVPEDVISRLITNHGLTMEEKKRKIVKAYAKPAPITPEAREQLIITSFLISTLFPDLDY